MTSRRILFIIAVAALGAMVIFLPLMFGAFEGWKPSGTEFIMQYLGVVVSCTSALMVADTLILQRKQLQDLALSNKRNFEITQNSYDTHVLNLIESMFLAKEMSNVRATCFHLKEELKHNEHLRRDITEIFKKQIVDDWGDFETFKLLIGAETYNYYYSFERLARYFDTLSNYQLSETTSRVVHFYYVWWRGLIIDMKECYLKAENEIAEKDKFLSFQPNWISMQDRLDSQLLQYGLPLK